ncbi:MAG TPA: ACT domain-containing protein [bacterium]|nr:ACT domain-containing protein [bacterium]HPO10107.1 ACT domain-containing protein [bacterium]HQO35287.1 ACT domain-containing protein [bacterium]HQP96827.1 ACT domain-containing protein [bacterium]
MKLRQISIFLENQAGRMAEVTGILGRAGVNIRAIALADTADFGIIRLIVDKTDKALEVLKNEGITVKETQVVAVEIPDRPGALAAILNILGKAGINVEYLYGFLDRVEDRAIMVFRFEDPDQALGILTKEGYQALNGSRVHSM